MAREDILDVLWPSQVTANSIFMGSLRQNNPFGNPDVCLVFTSSFERSCLGSSSASGHPPGTGERRDLETFRFKGSLGRILLEQLFKVVRTELIGLKGIDLSQLP